MLHKLCAPLHLSSFWQMRVCVLGICINVCACMHLYVCVYVCVRPGQLKSILREILLPRLPVCACSINIALSFSLHLSLSIWFTPACVSVGGGPSGQIWRSFGHSLRTWRVSLPCVSCNALSAHQSGQTSTCSRPRCICMAFPLETKTEMTTVTGNILDTIIYIFRIWLWC